MINNLRRVRMRKVIKETIHENVERCFNMSPLQFGDILYPIGSMAIQKRVIREYEDYTSETITIHVSTVNK